MENLENEFNNLSIKFLFVCDDNSELNKLLNDLNSLDYKCQQISDSKLIVQFIESLIAKVSTTSESNIIIKCCHLLKQLISKQKPHLSEITSNKIIKWIIKTQSNSRQIFACEALDVLSLIFKRNSKAASLVSYFILIMLQ